MMVQNPPCPPLEKGETICWRDRGKLFDGESMVEDLVNSEEEVLAKLAPQELSLRLMGLPAKKRLEAVLSRPDAAAVVAELPVQDFFFFVKELGADDALPILALGKVEQLVHLFDLEWWEKDCIQPAKALQWLERLAMASEEKLLAWLYHADFELLTVLFGKWLRVVVAPEDIDLLEASEELPKHTLDDQYFWETQFLQFEDFLGRLLSLLFEVHSGFYRELMNHVIWVSEAEMEEDAYRFSRGRLEDQAIPDFYDALQIYSAIRPGEIEPGKDAVVRMSAPASTPSFALALLPGEELLNQALSGIEDAEKIDTLRLELAALANKVILADQLALDEPRALHWAIEKVAAYVNLGLDLMSHGSLAKAVKILEEVFLEYLFRLAHTQLVKLKASLRELIDRGWPAGWPTGLKCLDADWLEAAELLLQKTPRLFRPVSGPDSSRTEGFFKTRRDLAQAGHLVDVLHALGPLLGSLSTQPAELQEKLWQEGQIRRIEDLTLGILIWTAAAQFQIHGTWEVAPLNMNRWAEEFGLLQPAVIEKSIRAWVERIMPDAPQRELIKTYLEPLFQEYAQEMLPFTPDKPPDPRLVRFFMFEEE